MSLGGTEQGLSDGPEGLMLGHLVQAQEVGQVSTHELWDTFVICLLSYPLLLFLVMAQLYLHLPNV